MNGRRLTLLRPSEKDADDIWSYHAELSIPGGRAEIAVWDIGDEIGEYIRDVADASAGFDGSKEYASLEGQVRLTCRHDGNGVVECTVNLRDPGPPGWTFEAVLHFGAGEQLSRIADEVESFIPSSP
jgi:hypothetical protein